MGEPTDKYVALICLYGICVLSGQQIVDGVRPEHIGGVVCRVCRQDIPGRGIGKVGARCTECWQPSRAALVSARWPVVVEGRLQDGLTANCDSISCPVFWRPICARLRLAFCTG